LQERNEILYTLLIESSLQEKKCSVPSLDLCGPWQTETNGNAILFLR